MAPKMPQSTMLLFLAALLLSSADARTPNSECCWLCCDDWLHAPATNWAPGVKPFTPALRISLAVDSSVAANTNSTMPACNKAQQLPASNKQRSFGRWLCLHVL
jgi:hypothetical protein